MADHGFENKPKWKKVYKSSPFLAFFAWRTTEEIYLKFSNKLFGWKITDFISFLPKQEWVECLKKNKMQ
jgi:hypothetical protein